MVLGWHTETGQPTLAVLGSGQPTLQHQEVRGPSTGTDRKSASAAMEEDNLGSHHEVKHQEKKMCVQTHRLHPDAPGARDARDAPWQRTYCSQPKTHRQCEFGRSSPRHHAPGRRSPRHLLTGRSVVGHFRSRRMVSGHFPSGHTESGHFPSGRSRVRVFSYWMQPCQGIFLLDAAVSGQMASG